MHRAAPWGAVGAPPPPASAAAGVSAGGAAGGGLTARSDGVSSCVDAASESLLVYGGQVAAKVWQFSLRTFRWSELLCGGDVPPARRHHSAVCYGGHMLVFGGEMVSVTTRERHPAGTPPCYELDLETRLWRAVATTGTAPCPRSHHTAVMKQGTMVVYGGKPTDQGRPVRQTRRDLESDILKGFFNVYLLDVTARRWSVVPAPGSRPMLWGHTTALFRHFLLHFGGFEVHDPSTGSGDLPTAELSDVVHIWNAETGAWSKCGPHGQKTPTPRALHCAAVWEAEMLVFGGVAIDPATGQPVLVNDAWWWDIAQGTWSQLTPFCLERWASKRLPFAVHDDRLIVCPGVSRCCLLPLRQRPTGWRQVQCDAAALAKPVAGAPQLPTGVQTTTYISPPRRKAAPLPDADAARRELDPAAAAAAPETAAPPAPALEPALDPPPPDTAEPVPAHIGHAAAPVGGRDAVAELHVQLHGLQEQVEELTGLQRRMLQSTASAAPEDHQREWLGTIAERMAEFEREQHQLQEERLRRQEDVMQVLRLRHREQMAELQREREEMSKGGRPEADSAQAIQDVARASAPAPTSQVSAVAPLAALAGDVGRLAEACMVLSKQPPAAPQPQPAADPPDAAQTEPQQPAAAPQSNRVLNYQRERQKKRAHAVRRMQHLEGLRQVLLDIDASAEADAARDDAVAGPPLASGHLSQLLEGDFSKFDAAALPIGRLLSPPGSFSGSPARIQSPPRPTGGTLRS